jgi:hypothetical protein
LFFETIGGESTQEVIVLIHMRVKEAGTRVVMVERQHSSRSVERELGH